MPAPVVVAHDVALRWVQHDGAESCIAEHELAAAVTARLGPDHAHVKIVIASPALPGDAAVPKGSAELIEGEIAPGAAGWTATIRTVDDHGVVLGQRDLHEPAHDCRELDAKLVLVIALIIDPELLAPAPPAPPPPPPPPVKPKPVIIVAPHEPWHAGASVAALATRGMLPGFGFGTSIALRLEPPHFWPFEISATLWPYDRTTAGSGGVTLLELTGGLALCPQLVGPLALCVGAQAGEVRARGFDFDHNQLEHELVLDGTAELRLDWQLADAIGARFGAAAWVPVSRPRFVVHEGSSDVLVYQSSAAAWVGEIALWMRF